MYINLKKKNFPTSNYAMIVIPTIIIVRLLQIHIELRITTEEYLYVLTYFSEYKPTLRNFYFDIIEALTKFIMSWNEASFIRKALIMLF